MKFAVFATILACLCICYVSSVKETNWGNVYTRQMGIQQVVAKSSMFQVQNRTFTFPSNFSTPFYISGIKHMDFKSHPVTVRFLRGGIGQRNVTIGVESQRGHGINSTFIFYTL